MAPLPLPLLLFAAIVVMSAVLAGWLAWRERAAPTSAPAAAPASAPASAPMPAPPDPSPAHTSLLAAPAPMPTPAGSAGRFRLAAVQGMLSGVIIPVDDEVIVSRGPIHWVAVPDATVSAPHAALDLGSEPGRIKDLGSRNGTRLGQAALGAGYADLPAGQPAGIAIGSLGLELQARALRVIRGPQQGKSFSLPAAFVALSRREIPIFVTGAADSRISDAHALISVDGDRLTIKDLNSSNGIRVNQSRLTAAVRLNPGDIVEIGATSFKVEH